MENNFIDDDDDNGDILDEDAEFDEFMFGGEALLQGSSDESNGAIENNNSISSNDANNRNNETTPNVNQTPEQKKLLNEFNLESCAKKFQSKAGTGDLITELNNHWKNYVPICFNALDTPTKNLIDTDSNKILLKPLEIYLCNDLDCDTALSRLNELEDPPELCGKVFKAGEPSYFCRDCGSDPTCVLCSNCFTKSEHRHHRYKMMTSGGGGYCDCGDPEAWKSHPNCELHKPKSSSVQLQQTASSSSLTDQSTFVNKLPVDFTQRATGLFSYLLEYIHKILSIENSKELPDYLRPEKINDDYVTILYNDEVHSYEQVVSTLRKVLTIDDKKAFEYAAIVDKEGRSTIKRGKEIECEQIKTKVETTMGNTALETKVMHHSLVAHQYFAERLVVWLQKICEQSKSLKHILCQIGLFSNPDSHSTIEKLMLADSIFWKSARTIMHQFFISIYFMDPYWKREFAILYTKNYEIIWNNHVKNPDDTVSLTDLAVQMFTVLSLSKYLLTHHNLLETIMNTLIKHCKTNKGKLSFPRSRLQRNNPEFKRAQYMLFDLKYCLTATPDEWNDNLRLNFIKGFKSFVEFIKYMHGMDSLKRYTQQHVEFEPEWETSFNLLIKLQKSISSLIEWCSSDRIVYFECYKYLLNAIHQVESNESLFTYKYEKVKFEGHGYEIIDYAVIKQEVSIHAPLTRLFASIYAQMEKFGFNFNTIILQLQSSSLNPLSSLKHDLPKSKMISLIEPSIRALCLVSQTNCGLWKRNGFSLLSQVYFYSNIKCRQEMFDRDILCLQIGASMMDSNEFLINLLSHFSLYSFLTEENFELPSDSSDDLKLEFLIPLSEDFLELLIYIYSERYEPNLSKIEQTQRLEREVIHQLCIQPQAHSDLVKNIYPDNEKYTNELESVLKRVAIFKNSTSSSTSKGVYELKPEYQSYYSPYFYHYVKSERTKSEEYQLSLKKEEKDKFFKPPRLPPLTNLFKNLIHLLDSDLFIRIVFIILRRFNSKSNLGSEGQLIRLLHLIGLALHEEQDDVDKNFDSFNSNESTSYNFKFLEKTILTNPNSSSKKSTSLFSIKSFKTEDNLTKMLNETVKVLTTESYKHLTNWILDYSQRLLKLKHKIDQQKQNSNEDVVKMSTEAAQLAEQEASDEMAKRKNLIAEKRRAKIMSQMNKQQKDFIKNFKDLYEETKTATQSNITPTTSESNFDLGDLSKLSQEKAKKTVICLGPNQTSLSELNLDSSPKQTKRYHCILCQEDDDIVIGKDPMVLCCFIQSSRVLSKNRTDYVQDFEEFDPLFMKNTLNWGINTTSCGHVMHAKCWQKYVETVRLAENRRHARYHGFNIKRNEYLCPLCETIGNCVLPIFPDIYEFTKISSTSSLNREPSSFLQNENSMDFISGDGSTSSILLTKFSPSKSTTKRTQINISYSDWLDGLEKTIENSIKKENQDDKDVFIINPCPLSTITKLMADAVAATNFRSLFEFDALISGASSSSSIGFKSTNFNNNESKLNDNTIDIMENFTRGSYTFGFSKLPFDDDSRMPISVWTNCSYTIQVIDHLLNTESKSLFGQFTLKQVDLLSNIVKQAALYGIIKNTDLVRKNCIRLLAGILPYKIAIFDPKNIMDIDMFYMLVSLCLSLPNLYDSPKLSSVANGGINDSNIFKLVLQAHCVQILLTKIKLNTFLDEETVKNIEWELEEDNSTNSVNLETKNESDMIIYNFYKHLLEQATGEKNIFQFNDNNNKKLLMTKSPKIISYTLKHALMPFLRCSALFFSNLTNLTPSSSNQISHANDLINFNKNFGFLTKFLDFSLDDVLDVKSTSLLTLIDSWLSTIASSDFKLKEKILDYPVKSNQFIELPLDYVDLVIKSMSSHACSLRSSSVAESSSESATILCLICGEMLCSQAYCCQQEIFKKRVGCCTAHAYKCSGSVGVFLRVSECQVLLLHLNMVSQEDTQVRGCFVAAPYLDDYGETDQGLRRGNPLHLCKIRYNKLYKDWLSHAIPEEVSRSFQNQTNMLNINWIEL